MWGRTGEPLAPGPGIMRAPRPPTAGWHQASPAGGGQAAEELTSVFPHPVEPRGQVRGHKDMVVSRHEPSLESAVRPPRMQSSVGICWELAGHSVWMLGTQRQQDTGGLPLGVGVSALKDLMHGAIGPSARGALCMVNDRRHVPYDCHGVEMRPRCKLLCAYRRGPLASAQACGDEVWEDTAWGASTSKAG